MMPSPMRTSQIVTPSFPGLLRNHPRGGPASVLPPARSRAAETSRNLLACNDLQTSQCKYWARRGVNTGTPILRGKTGARRGHPSFAARRGHPSFAARRGHPSFGRRQDGDTHPSRQDGDTHLSGKTGTPIVRGQDGDTHLSGGTQGIVKPNSRTDGSCICGGGFRVLARVEWSFQMCRRTARQAISQALLDGVRSSGGPEYLRTYRPRYDSLSNPT